MPFEDFQAAIAASRPSMLPEITSALWRAFGAGALDEAQVERLSGLIEARTVAARAGENPDATRRGSSGPADRAGSPRKAVGSRPRTSDCLARRRRWAASGWMPPAIAARFTTAEQAVLAVIAVETAKRGDCRLAIGHIAAVAGVSRSTVKGAIRQARMLGLASVEERRRSRFRSETNVVRIISPEWTAWLRLVRRSPDRGSGVKFAAGRNTGSRKQAPFGPSARSKGLPKDRDRPGGKREHEERRVV